jgi:hypothetical protein
MNKIFLWLMAGLLFIVCGLTACGGNNNPGTDTPNTGNTTAAFDEKAVLKETQAVVNGIVENITAGDVEGVLEKIEESTRLQLGDLDLSSHEAKKLAEAISSAKPVQVDSTIVFYETIVEGETLSFYILKEGGEWKLGGL